MTREQFARNIASMLIEAHHNVRAENNRENQCFYYNQAITFVFDLFHSLKVAGIEVPAWVEEAFQDDVDFSEEVVSIVLNH